MCVRILCRVFNSTTYYGLIKCINLDRLKKVAERRSEVEYMLGILILNRQLQFKWIRGRISSCILN